MDKVSRKVSVVVLAYNHVQTIDQCLGGIFMQDFDGTIEVVLGEDGSTDGTREKCINWANRHPDRIKLLLNSRADNISINGKPTGTANWIKCLSHCDGDYIAICEGDDYWIDAGKIQSQADCMDSDDGISICYHRVLVEQDGALKSDKDSVTEQRYSQIQNKNDLGLKVMVEVGNFIHTPAVMIRRVDLLLISMSRHSAISDYLTYLTVLSNGGRIAKLDGPAMAVYRSGSGTFSGQAYHLQLLDQLSCLTSALLLPIDEEYRAILLKRSNTVRKALSQHCNNLLNREPGIRQIFRIVWKKFQRRIMGKA